MPIYSYVCSDCGEEFDLLVGVGSGKEELKCKKCDGKNIKKVFATFSTRNSGDSTSSSSGSSCPTGTCSLS